MRTVGARRFSLFTSATTEAFATIARSGHSRPTSSRRIHADSAQPRRKRSPQDRRGAEEAGGPDNPLLKEPLHRATRATRRHCKFTDTIEPAATRFQFAKERDACCGHFTSNPMGKPGSNEPAIDARSAGSRDERPPHDLVPGRSRPMTRAEVRQPSALFMAGRLWARLAGTPPESPAWLGVERLGVERLVLVHR